MIDTHSHIYVEDFEQDLDEVVARARQAGVERILLPNINEDSISRMFSVTQRFPDVCSPMIGLHPEDVREDWRQVLDRMEPYLDRVVAVGEVGLDFYWDTTYKAEQLEAFEYQIMWAKQYNLPLVIHMRKAEPELLSIMERYKSDGLRGIFHCFGGSKESAQRFLKYEGFALGIGGVVTFKNSHLAETLKYVPLERIVLETDAPYLSPVPFRGKRNEPAYVKHVAEFLANIYDVSVLEIIRKTDSTAKQIFGQNCSNDKSNA